MALLTWEDGLVKIDGHELPGFLSDLNVDCRVKFDEQDVDGQSGKKRTPLGWEDSEVYISLILTTEDDGPDCYEKLETINSIFRGHDAKANPKIFNVDNRHLLARGVSRLIFSGLNSGETEDDDTMYAGLCFVEHNPPVVKTESNVAKSALDKAKKNKDKAAAQNKIGPPDIPAVDPAPVIVDLK